MAKRPRKTAKKEYGETISGKVPYFLQLSQSSPKRKTWMGSFQCWLELINRLGYAGGMVPSDEAEKEMFDRCFLVGGVLFS